MTSFFENDLYNLENNINNINIHMLFINNNILENIIKEKVLIKNNIFEKKDFIEFVDNKINSNDIKNKYKLEYILNFYIAINNDQLIEIDNNIEKNKHYFCDVIKSFDNIKYQNNFNEINTIYLIFNKIAKLNIKKKYKKNVTRKKCN
tara:strand:- start:188 stop:631 length:444 start_codon:yes stop_codon:yes gene_type:complete